MESERVKLLLDKEWTLENFGEVSKLYNQLYAFAYSLAPNLADRGDLEVELSYSNLPWRGGFSTVNFFHDVFRKIPEEYQPQVKRITYASPGFIELATLAGVAFTVYKIVGHIAGSIRACHDVYHHIQKGIRERKLSSLEANLEELKLAKSTLDFCEKSCADMVRVLGLSPEEDQMLDARTKGNKLMKMKLLMSVYRRAEPLAKKQAIGMLKVSSPLEDD